MKNSVKLFLVYSLIIFFVASLLKDGLALPSSGIYLLATLIVLSLTIMIACPLLNFLTVKCKFPTFFIMSSLLLVGVLFLLKIFMIDFYIETFTFAETSIGTLQINSFEVSPVLTIVGFSLLTSLFAGIFRALDNRD